MKSKEIRENLQTYIAEAPPGNKGNIPDTDARPERHPAIIESGISPACAGNHPPVPPHWRSLSSGCCAATQNLPFTPLGIGLPFIFQVVLLLLLPLAVVYLISVVALIVDLLQTSFRRKRAHLHLTKETAGKDAKPHIGNFSQ